jgi:sulfur-oxidizing protein SoxX
MGTLLKIMVPVAVLALAAGCDLADTSSGYFALPEGDAARGQEIFISLGCTSCHRIPGLDLPIVATEGPVMVVLGGNVSRVKSYDELVTSIINPSHRLARGIASEKISAEGESLMAAYNDVLTVSELIDIVAFLQSEYKIIERPGYRYPVYEYD